jgi:NAD(P)-dependent dehydrogenase (short-subunit alcohol dehydrogenase family)
VAAVEAARVAGGSGDPAAPAVLLTGAGSGMGLECALHLAASGYRVFGGVLNEAEGLELRGEAERRRVALRSLRMDVTRPADIEAAINTVVTEAGRIDALVHFAGLGLRGFFEDLTLEEIRRVYDVNVFGTMAVTQAVLPHMRAAGRGRIVLTTSVAGRMGSMSISGYASSKFAVEGFAECLHQEVAPFGIAVSLLEPGLIATEHFTRNRNRAARAVDPASPYYAWFCQHEKIVDDLLRRNRFTKADVARLVQRILTARRPRLRYVVGGKARLILALRRHVPGELFERVYWGVVRRLVTKPARPARGLGGPPGEGESRGDGPRSDEVGSEGR